MLSPSVLRAHGRSLWRTVGLLLASAPAWATAPAPLPALLPAPPTASLPERVRAALQQAHLPETALVAQVQEVTEAPQPPAPVLSWQAELPVNPASVFKLATTAAALDLLGPAWRWHTPVAWRGEPSEDGVLDGSVWIQGRGDPTLTLERVWLLLRRLQAHGVREIRGDIVLDRSAWRLPATSPADFDGDATRPYNVQPDALLLNLKAYTLQFRPLAEQGLARISSDTPLAGVSVAASVPLSGAACDDWRAALQPDFSDPTRIRFAGRYPLRCGDKTWPLAYADPARFNSRLIDALWRELGGRLGGQVREGTLPPDLASRFDVESPPLAEVVRDINKFSNNVMAEQLFLSLPAEAATGDAAPAASAPHALASAAPAGSHTAEEARALLQAWLARQLGPERAQGLVVANGSGLTRDGRISARQLGDLLQHVWRSPWMPELLSSLPVSGRDGTLQRATVAVGQTHLKTGSLRDVMAVAGVVQSPSGRRWVLVAMVNHPRAAEARPVLEALTQWVFNDAGSSDPAGQDSAQP